MMESSKDKILVKVRTALKNTVQVSGMDAIEINRLDEQVQSLRVTDTRQLIDRFSKELELVNGVCHGPFSNNEAADSIAKVCLRNKYDVLAISAEDMIRSIAVNLNLKNQIQILQTWKKEWPERKTGTANISASFFKATYGVAEIGQLVLLYDQSQTTMPHFLCDHSLVLLSIKDIIFDHFHLFENMPADQVKNMVFITGPSRTADIEKVLVLGAHGPRKLDVFLID